MWVFSIIYIIIIGTELYIQKLRIFVKNLIFNPSKVFLIMSLICSLLVIPMRYSCETYGEDVLIIMSIVFKSTYILYLGRLVTNTSNVLFKFIKKRGENASNLFVFDFLISQRIYIRHHIRVRYSQSDFDQFRAIRHHICDFFIWLFSRYIQHCPTVR